jgi:hypothetical protein
MELLSHNIDLADDGNALGEVRSGSLRVSSLVRRLLRFKKDQDLIITDSFIDAELRLNLDHPGNGMFLQYVPVPLSLESGKVVYVAYPLLQKELPDEQLEGSRNPEVLSQNCALLLVMTYIGERYSQENCYYNIEKSTDIDGFALAITEVPGHLGVYERIAIARVEVEGRLHHQSRASYLDEADFDPYLEDCKEIHFLLYLLEY